MSDPKSAVETRANDDVTTNHPQTRRRPGRLRGSATRLSKSGHRIELPDGDALVPREDLAADLRISSRSLARLNPSTTIVGGVAYVRDKATRQLLADRASKPKRKHRATRTRG